MAMGETGRGDGAIAAINITPLIDVMLVAASGVCYARVIEAVDAAKGAGAERIGLVPAAPAKTGQAAGS